MKIAIDLRRINNPGIGRYMKGLTEAVLAHAPEHEYVLILPSEGPRVIGAESANVKCINPRLPYYSVREQIELPRILHKERVDVFHSPHFNLPLRRVCPAVVTIHDVIYLACRGDLPSRIGRLYYRGMMKAAVRLAERVLTDSQFSRQDIIRYLGCEAGKIEVVYPAVQPGFVPTTETSRVRALLSRLGIDEEFVLYTGIYKPRKNHYGLLQAFRYFLESGARAKLVIAGPLGDGGSVLRQLVMKLGIGDRVLFPGFVSDEDLPALYTAARVYACPSLYEGFGFTVLEAMSCGVPVVCSAETSLPEAAGSAALYADPRRPQDFAAAIHRAFSDAELRGQLIASGFVNVRRFSWAGAASRALAAYEHAAGISLERVVCA